MTDLVAALALAIILEGLLYAAFPDQMKKALLSLLETPSSTIRVVALTCAMLALMVLFMVRG